jgi:hypothetical protein
MFEMQNTIIDDSIPWVKFACDTRICKGACCTMAGGMGAPLLNEEISIIERSFEVVRNDLPEEHRKTIERKGLYEGDPDTYTTTCYNNRACVFVIYEDGIARCSIEKAFFAGRLEWRKPVSCHLFPIRVEIGSEKRLRYERITECIPALNRGEAEGIFLLHFIREPLIRSFGSSWYNNLDEVCRRKRTEYLQHQGVTGQA